MTLLQGIRSDIKRISKTVEDLSIASSEPGRNRPAAMAQYLSQFYTGLESCLEKKLKLEDVALPEKTDRYHRSVLNLAFQKDLIPASCVRITTDLLSFRHFARHAYGADFDLEMLKEKAAHAEKAWSEIKALWQAELEE